MSVAIAARFLGGKALPEFALVIAERDAKQISERFPSPVSFGVGHSIGSGDHWGSFSEGMPPKNRASVATGVTSARYASNA